MSQNLDMPFTATHVAAAVPVAWLCRWRVPFSALAIGSMLPDVAGFYPTLFDYSATHSLWGVFTHCVPMGILAYYLYHSLIKRPLADLLPSAASERLRPWTETPIDFSLGQIAAVIACLAFGALTHVVWDAFSHNGRWGIEVFPALGGVATEQFGHSIRWYALIQHGSSIILLPPLLIGFAIWIRRQPRLQAPLDRAQMPRSVSWTVIAFMMVGTLLYFDVIRTAYPHLRWISIGGKAVKNGGAVMMIVMLLYCCGMHYLWWRERSRHPYVVEHV